MTILQGDSDRQRDQHPVLAAAVETLRSMPHRAVSG
jgi:hypothetical protein